MSKRIFLLRGTNGLTLKFIFDHIVNIGVAYTVFLSGNLILSEKTTPYKNLNQDNVFIVGYGLIMFGILLGLANALQFFLVAHEEAIGVQRFAFIFIIYIALAIPVFLGVSVIVLNMVNFHE